jgi:hypothetical protein
MSMLACCPVLELRQYTLRPGMRDVLIELFEREFIESQEALGMTLVGQFRDLDDPNRFVWLRGFADMATRARALNDFYGGPVWKTHREAANDTMIDSDNVLLLRPARPDSGFSLANAERQTLGATDNPRGLVVATIYHLRDGTEHEMVNFFERAVQLQMTKSGAGVIAYFVTETHPNTFPALPVREAANVFVWFSVFADGRAYDRHVGAFADSLSRNNLAEELERRLKEPPEVLRLLPTRCSRLHG